ncbi:FK506-binding protein-like [Antennarius striatus]|uniref:FK506-binding protein-like n=1 Tax=Antennarius striatus TaxID=241820 RepID=UPI0035B0E922
MDESMNQTPASNGTPDGVDVTSWVSVCPTGLYNVRRTRIGEGGTQTTSYSGNDASYSSSLRPVMGSLCQVRVQLKGDVDEAETFTYDKGNQKLAIQPEQSVTEFTEAVATVFPRCQKSVLQVPLGEWTVLRLGEGQCDITEACVELMRAGEKCEILISPVESGSNVSVPNAAEENKPLCATVELKHFTPGQEPWTMAPGEKWEWVKSHKERGGARFRSCDVWGAADSYSRALKLLITLLGKVGEVKEKRHQQEVEEPRDTNTTDNIRCLPSVDELKTTKAELHSNLSLCQLRLNQPKRAKASAAKAAQLDPGGTKAWYRLGQACQMVNELEEAKQAFKKVLEIQPESPAALKALKEIASREKETNAQLGQRLSKMFN